MSMSTYRSILSQTISTAILAALTTLAAAAPLAAQEAQPPAAPAQQPPAGQTTTLVDPGHWTVTPFVGVGFSGDLDNATGAVGVAGGYVWSSRVALEAELSFLPSSETSGLIELDSDSWTLTGNALYHFAGRSWVPYLLFGLGFGHGSVDLDTNGTPIQLDTSSNEFIVNFGGGAERRIRDNFAFRGDLRYFFGGDFVPDYWRASAGVTFDIGRQ